MPKTDKKESAESMHKEPMSEKVMEKITIGIAERLKESACKAKNCADLLVVDDNEFNRFILMQILNKYGFRCRTVTLFREGNYYVIGN